MKTIIKPFFSRLGYEIKKIPQGYEIKKITKTSPKIKNHQDNQANNHYLYAQYSLESINKKRFYNIGAGNFKHNYWTNIDYQSEHYQLAQKNNFIHYDLMECKPLPIGKDTAELIYTSHTIEHVNNEAVLNLFQECYRVLKPEAGLRVTCPDAKLLYTALKHEDKTFWYSKHKHFKHYFDKNPDEISIYDFFIRDIATSRLRFCKGVKTIQLDEAKALFNTLNYEDFLNSIVSECNFDPSDPGRHINWWDEVKITNFLKEAGFKNIYRSRFGQSRFSPLRNTKLFDKTQPEISLYIEAIK